jgi:hypothetical protein
LKEWREDWDLSRAKDLPIPDEDLQRLADRSLFVSCPSAIAMNLIGCARSAGAARSAVVVGSAGEKNRALAGSKALDLAHAILMGRD